MLLNNLRSLLSRRPTLNALPRYSFAIRKQFLEASLNNPSQTIIDINNGCIYFKDPNNQFSYMNQFTTNQHKGVVVDIRDQYTGGILYNPHEQVTDITPTSHHASSFSSPLHFRNIYGVDEAPINELNDEDPIEYQNFKSGNLRVTTSKSQKIPIFDPLVDLCYPIYEGDFKVLEGGRKTGKSEFLFSTIQDLLKINYKVIYFNLNKNECLKLKSLQGDWIAFTQTEESAGSLFLAYKVVKLAEYLVNQGENVVVVMENIDLLLEREASIFSNFSQPVAPFSIVNSLFGLSGKTSMDDTTLTTFLTIQQSSKEQKASNVYSNSLKHVKSLSDPIRFPLEVRRSEGGGPLSHYINRINQQKNEIEQKKLFRIPVDSYDYYFYYDSPWWIKSLKKYKPTKKNTLNLFYRFLEWNIQKDYCSQWEIPAERAFKNFLEYIDPSIEMFLVGEEEKMQELFQEFLVDSRIKGHFSPFKKDYL